MSGRGRERGREREGGRNEWTVLVWREGGGRDESDRGRADSDGGREGVLRVM